LGIGDNQKVQEKLRGKRDRAQKWKVKKSITPLCYRKLVTVCTASSGSREKWGGNDLRLGRGEGIQGTYPRRSAHLAGRRMRKELDGKEEDEMTERKKIRGEIEREKIEF